ncbi:MAG: hypothetical protein R6W68_12410 [Ignavibacteriaceae bacterium]
MEIGHKTFRVVLPKYEIGHKTFRIVFPKLEIGHGNVFGALQTSAIGL